MPQSLLVFGISLAATMAGSMSGGSSSLLTTPAWVALGYPLPTAVGSDKVAGAFWTLVGARNYLRRRAVDWNLVAAVSAFGAVGAWIGVRFTTTLDPRQLARVVGAMIMVVVLGVAARPALGREERPPRFSKTALAWASFPLGFYEGMFGSGNSIAMTVLLTLGRGYDLLRALGHYYLIAATWCTVAAALYAQRGFVEPGLAIPATIGAMTGGYLGSRIGNRVGARVVRWIFIAAGLGLGGKLLLTG